MANKPIETYGLHSQKNVWYHNQLDKDDGEIEKKITFVRVMNNTIDHIEEAVQIATTANYGRKSPDGKPGILHPLTVGLGGKTSLIRHMLVMDRAGGREDLIKKHTEAFEYLQKAAGK